MMIYVRYQDDGPIGMTGQLCSTTNGNDVLHIFNNENSAREFQRKVEASLLSGSRRNPRVSGYWDDKKDKMFPSVHYHFEEINNEK